VGSLTAFLTATHYLVLSYRLSVVTPDTIQHSLQYLRLPFKNDLLCRIQAANRDILNTNVITDKDLSPIPKWFAMSF